VLTLKSAGKIYHLLIQNQLKNSFPNPIQSLDIMALNAHH